ncbi:transcriptional regulator with cyclic nucleotide-binding domain [Actinokineospora spheciospongiae]|uniref:Transcriptional regulator with cyclic nucleotide-binding domain n=1 Tax=Actinokineospora spheciospongiae TaxID=909613 RepID=W7IGU1_9PSEU|nr:Crp/Fnr family transcriptional regulator [Actinokineospora spheciospongiae]EWC59508.1 transcriptional regulator with cyclic nucleotide-binding domain [Actinokineospora spheciospongiae]PWW65918.1 CRP-like cAMP-binding protein [Actinokineospora spheciospongiae]
MQAAVAGRWLPGTFLARLGPVAPALLDLGRSRVLGAGERLITQGDDNTSVFLLESADRDSAACVKVTATTPNGTESLLGIRLAGDIVGELAALRDDGRRSATVTTCTETVVHAVTHERFLGFLRAEPVAWEALSRVLADRLDWANRRRLDFGGYVVRVRLARVLLELAERHGHGAVGGIALGVKLSQAELGRLIGAGADAAAGAVAELRRAGVLSTEYQRPTITDLAGLRELAGEN